MKEVFINIVGLGYIGLPTALMMAANGIHVIGTDSNRHIIDQLKQKQITFTENKLQTLFVQALENEISFEDKCAKADIYIVAVPTPYDKSNKKIDASYVKKAVKEVIQTCEDGAIIVIESTIAPGTIDKYIRPMLSECALHKIIHLVHAPERIIPGNMIDELVNNSRVIGADDKSIGEKIKELYAHFCKGEIVVTDIKTAEMSKVVENTYRDINIAFANELARICKEADMDVYEIIKTANMHPRVNILQPGPGVGGHCISVDPWFLVGDYPGLANLILTARKTNDSMPEFVLERIGQIMKENNINDLSRVGLYGLTYKEDVDDVRESPTLQLLDILDKHLSKGIKLYDPFVKETIAACQYQDFNQFISDIDLIVVMVGHSHIQLHLEKLKDKIIYDTRNVIKGKSLNSYSL